MSSPRFHSQIPLLSSLSCTLPSNTLMSNSAHETGILMHGEYSEGECGCFQSLWPKGQRRTAGDDDDELNLLPQRREPKELWVVTQLKKLKEASELVAGPKWKNFIRKIGAYFNSNKKRNDFQYDSFNYTLNFDNGIHEDEEDAGLGFSSRFAPPVHDKPRSSPS